LCEWSELSPTGEKGEEAGKKFPCAFRVAKAVHATRAFICRLMAAPGALVQIAGETETRPINMDPIFIEHDSIPDGGRSGIFESKNPEVELPLANAVHQLDAGNRGRGAPELLKAQHDLRAGPDVSMVLLDQIV